MAELPRYRPLGAAISSMPSVNFIQTGAAQAQVYDSISSALDQVSEFAFKKAVAQAEREGLQYGYNNPLTNEQINQALKGGLDINDVINEPDTIFGAASRAGTAARLRTDLEAQMRTQLAGFNAYIDGGGDFSPQALSQMEAQIQGNITGYSELLAQLDVDEAASFSATANTLASATYKNGLETVLKREQAVRRIDADKALDELPNELRAIIKASSGGFILDDEGNKISELDAALSVEANSIQQQIIGTNDIDFINSKSTAVESAIIEAKQGVLTDFAFTEGFAENPVEFSSNLRSGNFGRYSEVYNSLDPKQQAEVRQRIRTERTARENADTAQKTQSNNVYKAQAADLLVTIMKSDLGSQEEANAIAAYQSLFAASNGIIMPLSTIDGLLSNKTKIYETPTPAGAKLMVRQKIYEGTITDIPELMMIGQIDFGLTPADVIEMLPLLNTETKAQQTAIDKHLMRLAKIVPGTVPSEEKATQYFKLRDMAEDELAIQIQEWEASGGIGKKPTMMSVITGDFETTAVNTVADSRIEQIVSYLNTNYSLDGQTIATGITFDAETRFDKIEPILKKMGVSQNRIQDIKEKLTQIQIEIGKRIE